MILLVTMEIESPGSSFPHVFSGNPDSFKSLDPRLRRGDDWRGFLDTLYSASRAMPHLATHQRSPISAGATQLRKYSR